MSRRVVHLVSSPATSGVTATIKLVARGLRDRGWEPFLVHYGQQVGIVPEFINEGIPVYQIRAMPSSCGPLRTWWIVACLRKLLRKVSPCLINAHSFDADLLAARSLASSGPSILITIQSFSYVNWAKKHLKDYDRWGNRFSTLIPVCQSLGDEIRNIPAMSDIKTRVIFNVPDQRFFIPLEISERNQNRALLGFNSSDTVMACVANFHSVKGHDILARAFKLLIDKYPHIKLLIAGSAGSDPERLLFQKTVRDLLEKEIAQGQASIVDPCYDVRPILSAADIYVQPSHTEALSVSIGEALAVGLPVVATDVGGNPEIVINGRTGLLVPPAKPEYMADAIEGLLRDPILRQRLGEAAMKFAIECLSPSALLAAYDLAYEDALIQ